MLELIREEQCSSYFNSDRKGFYINVVPGVILEELKNFNCDYYNAALELCIDDIKKFIMIT